MKKSISGIRGIFGKDLNLTDVLNYCNNFSSLIKSGKCVIANDTRPSGVMMRETAAAALMKNGIDVYNLGMTPTPVVFREARKFGAGLIITSSHNPIEWNGLKFVLDGRGVNESELPHILERQEISNGKIGIEEEITTTYIQDARKVIGYVENQPQIVVDIGGGAARDIAPQLLSEIGCNVRTINDKLDNCSRGPDPTTDKLSDLVSSCKKNTIGFAFDLDGDRLVVVKDGIKQVPDVTLGLGIAKSIELGYKKFVLSLDSSISIEKLIKENGGTVMRSKVGEANVIELMIKTDAHAGGEGSSGGFILPEFNYCRDGILTSGLIASMLDNSRFDETISFMTRYHQGRDKVEIPSSYHNKIIEDVRNTISKNYSEIITIDGIKGIVDEDSWILIRESNTEDIIRVSAESNNKEKCKKIMNEAKNIVIDCYEKTR